MLQNGDMGFPLPPARMNVKLLLLATMVTVGLAGCADDGEESTNDELGDAPDPTEGIDQAGGEVEDNTTSDNATANDTNTTGSG